MKFYIPMKRHKLGFKIHLLCNSETHYLYKNLFRSWKKGKNLVFFTDNPSFIENIVLRKLSYLKNIKKRNLYFDGWYSSINLMKKLS